MNSYQKLDATQQHIHFGLNYSLPPVCPSTQLMLLRTEFPHTQTGWELQKDIKQLGRGGVLGQGEGSG